MNEKIVKAIYAALQIKKIPFTMYKTNKNTTTVFKFKDSIVQITDEKVVLNGEIVESVNNVVDMIKII